MNGVVRISLAAPLIDFTSTSLPSASLLAACGSLPTTRQQAAILLPAAHLPTIYWQASHSSKPGSPGRIMHTGPSASGAASTATAGAAAAA
jgi:hypothetical protein